jgi:Ca2+/H+ antiporter
MSSTYNPTEETINSILTGLLPVLIVGLFNGFEDSKRKTLSVINIFDDFVIFASIVVYPLITAIEWYQYYCSDYKKRVVATYTSVAIKLIIFYTLFLWFQYKNEVKENENNKNEGNGKNEGGNNENVEEKKIGERGKYKYG